MREEKMKYENKIKNIIRIPKSNVSKRKSKSKKQEMIALKSFKFNSADQNGKTC